MFSIESSDLHNVKNVSHRFYGRIGGTSPRPWDGLNTSYDVGDVESRVDENRARICFELNIEGNRLYTPRQIHGKHIMRVFRETDPSMVRKAEADALFTTEKGVAIAIQTADCAPVLIAAGDGSMVAAIHAGWRGAYLGIIEESVKTICRTLDLNPGRLIASIGPAIGPRSFEVGEEVIEAVGQTSFASEIMRPTPERKAFVDLPLWCKKILESCGVENISIVERDTVSEQREFFSYRAQHGQCGRQLSVIMLT